MNNKTNLEDKIRALLEGEGSAEDKIQAIYEDLLPPVLPDPLFGARATHPAFGEGVIISRFPDDDGTVRFMFRDDRSWGGTDFCWVSTSDLTFHTPDHPVFLETEEDYRSAPEGTVVAQDDERPAVLVDDLWMVTGSWERDHDSMAGVRRRVLRWRWEA